MHEFHSVMYNEIIWKFLTIFYVGEGDSFLKRLIAINELCVHPFEPESKLQFYSGTLFISYSKEFKSHTSRLDNWYWQYSGHGRSSLFCFTPKSETVNTTVNCCDYWNTKIRPKGVVNFQKAWFLQDNYPRYRTTDKTTLCIRDLCFELLGHPRLVLFWFQMAVILLVHWRNSRKKIIFISMKK